MARPTVFDKIRNVKHLIEKECGHWDDDSLLEAIQRISTNWVNKKRRKNFRLKKDELQLYETLTNHKYNVSTVYRWLLLDRSPPEVKEKLKAGLISQRNASKEKNRFNVEYNVSEARLLEQITDLVGRFIIR